MRRDDERYVTQMGNRKMRGVVTRSRWKFRKFIRRVKTDNTVVVDGKLMNGSEVVMNIKVYKFAWKLG